MGCGCSNSEADDQTQSKSKLITVRKQSTISTSKGNQSIFYNYRFNNKIFTSENNILIYTIDKFYNNNFVTLYEKRESLVNNTFKDKTVAISYNKGYKLDSPNQDKFFILIDGDIEVFLVGDGHGPFGHKVAQMVCEFIFKV